MAPACSGNGTASLCRDVCDCEGCSEREEEECIEAADEATDDAEKEGCGEEFDAYVDCLDESFKCDDDNAVFTTDCANEVEDLSDCGGSPPIVGNLCDRAAEICGAVGEGEGECSGAAECASQCIVDQNSCDFTANQSLAGCIQGCA
jgi:hypothetical protein